MSEFQGLTAAILAGGLGTRLRSKVADRPKVMAEVHGKPFLTYLLDQLADSGIQNVVLCTGFLAEKIQAEFGAAYKGITLHYSQETQLLGTAGALRLALPMFHSDPVLVFNGDSFLDINLKDFFTSYAARPVDAFLALAKVDDTTRYGQVDLSDDGSVTRFIEKGKTNSAGWINAGIYLLSRKLIERIPSDTVISLEQEMFPALIGHNINGFLCEGRFLDIGIPEAYASAERFFISGAAR